MRRPVTPRQSGFSLLEMMVALAIATLLLALAVVRFVSSNLTERKSGGYGVLAAAATFLAVYLAARFVVVRFYKVPRSIHLDMARGQNPRRTLVH